MRFDRPIALSELAASIGGTVQGDGTVLINGLNEIHRVEEGDITFSDHPKYIAKALKGRASAVIVNAVPDGHTGKPVIIVDRPFDAFTGLCLANSHWKQATSLISPDAQIGPGTVIRPGAFIGPGVRIGSDCLIHSNATINDGCVLGDRVIVHSGAVIGSDAFYYKRTDAYRKLNSCGRVVIADDVEIGACCTIDRGVTADTVIGRGTKMDNHIHVGHDTVIGRNCLFAAQVGIAGVVTIEDDVILWGQVGVQKDLTIGRGAVVLGQSGIAGDLEGGVTYFGSPVREARAKMKELALIKQLPDIIRELKEGR
jgi:UDP-3-O-[3-hydroxymyristoyl] glucosamine N-acyltransferase